MFKRKPDPEPEMIWVPAVTEITPEIPRDVLVDVVKEALRQERQAFDDLREKLEAAERFALRVRDQRDALRVENDQLKEALADAKEARQFVQWDLADLMARHRALEEVVRATNGAMERQNADWDSTYNTITTERDALKDDLDWWVAEANHRGNVVLGMTASDPGWARSRRHDAGDGTMRPVDPESPTGFVDTNHNIGLLLDRATLSMPADLEWSTEPTTIEVTICNPDPELIAMVSGTHPAWEDPDGLFLNDNCIDDIRGYCILQGCLHGRNESQASCRPTSAE